MSIVKTYKSASTIGISVNLPSGKHRRITFESLYDGTSSFATGDENLQKALESDPRFGSMFKLQTAVDDSIVEAEIPDEGQNPNEDSADEIEEIEVVSLADAKEYLAVTFEIQRGKLRSKADIKAAAESHNIKFVGIDL